MDFKDKLVVITGGAQGIVSKAECCFEILMLRQNPLMILENPRPYKSPSSLTIFSKFWVAHSIKPMTWGMRLLPNSVMEYSTRGGTSG